jgi:hypothetical protein
MFHNSLMQAINCSSFAFLESRLSSAFVCFLWGASSGTACIMMKTFHCCTNRDVGTSCHVIRRLIPTYIKRACSANQSAFFHPIKNIYRDKNFLLLCHLSKVIKIACYSCQILKLFLIIVFLITVL